MKKAKWVVYDFLPYEYEVLENYLEQMSSKGWMLDKIYENTLKFKKSEKQELKYIVDYNKYDFVINQDTNESLQKNFLEQIKENNWNKLNLNKNDELNIYFTDDLNSEKIRSSPHERLKLISRLTIRSIFITFTIMLFYVFFDYNIGYINLRGLADDIWVLVWIAFFIIILSNFYYTYDFISWRKKVEKNLNAEDSLELNNKKNRTFRSKFSQKLILLLIILFVYAICDKNNSYKIIAIGFLVNYLIYLFIENKCNNFKYKKIIIISIIFIIQNSIVIYSVMNGGFKEYKRSDVPLVVEDFSNNTFTSKYVNANIKDGILADYIYYDMWDDELNLSYEIFASDIENIVDKNFDLFIKSEKRFGHEYDEIETNLPKDIKVYFENFIDDKYIIKDKRKMITINNDSEFNMDEDKFLKIIYTKIFKNAS